MSVPLPERPAPAAFRLATPRPAPALARAAEGRSNWPLYAYLFLLPLQNLQTGYMPNLGGGLNFLNVGFLFALLGAWYCRGTLTRWSSVHAWVVAYLAYGVFSLYLGYIHVQSDTADHFGVLKDSSLAVMLLFLVQMSATGWTEIRRLIVAMLLPLPYTLRVVWDQHNSVSSWHYSDNLRISGTFSMLGANEFAAFCVTMAVLVFALLLAAKLSNTWRVLLAGALACALLGVMWMYSRAGYVTLLLGMLSVVLLWRGRWKMVLPLVAAALIVPQMMPESVVERFDSTTIEAGKRDESTEMRFEFWQIAWDNFTERPLFGSGFHTFHHHEINPHNMDTHNFFMRELAEKGIAGFVITAGMLLAILGACWRTMVDAQPRSLAYALGLGMVAAWLALIIGNCFGDRFTYYPVIAYFWAWLGLTLKARELAVGERAPGAAPRPAAPVRRFAQPRGASSG
jgi:O-antigen ligase